MNSILLNENRLLIAQNKKLKQLLLSLQGNVESDDDQSISDIKSLYEVSENVDIDPNTINYHIVPVELCPVVKYVEIDPVVDNVEIDPVVDNIEIDPVVESPKAKEYRDIIWTIQKVKKDINVCSICGYDPKLNACPNCIKELHVQL